MPGDWQQPLNQWYVPRNPCLFFTTTYLKHKCKEESMPHSLKGGRYQINRSLRRRTATHIRLAHYHSRPNETVYSSSHNEIVPPIDVTACVPAQFGELYRMPHFKPKIKLCLEGQRIDVRWSSLLVSVWTGNLVGKMSGRIIDPKRWIFTPFCLADRLVFGPKSLAENPNRSRTWRIGCQIVPVDYFQWFKWTRIPYRVEHREG